MKTCHTHRHDIQFEVLIVKKYIITYGATDNLAREVYDTHLDWIALLSWSWV